MARAILGGGCFWCIEGAFKNIRGVISALPAYAGGHESPTTYQSVCSGKTGHAEVVEVEFEEEVIDFATILEVFFTSHDPTQLNRQGGDIGTQYRSTIMPTEPSQGEVAERIIGEMQGIYEGNIVTLIEEPIHFQFAEAEHHDYYSRNPNQGYCSAVIAPKLAKVRAKLRHLYID